MKKTTLSQVACQAGVSVTTASIVLNPGKSGGRISEECAVRVREIAQKLGYVTNYHAQSMKRGRSEVIGVALDSDFESLAYASQGDLGNTYFGSILGGVEIQARQNGYLMSIIGPDPKTRAMERALLGLRQGRFDGLVVPGVIMRRTGRMMLEEADDLPIVVIAPRRPIALPTIQSDETGGVRKMVEHLAALGHRDLLWLGPHRHGNPEVANMREQMFMTAVWDMGLRGSSCRMPHELLHNEERDAKEVIVRCARECLSDTLAGKSKPSFTALVCYNDLIALGALQVLREKGIKVPEEVSIGAFDDIEAGLAWPGITSVNFQLDKMGRTATKWILEMIQNPRDASKSNKQVRTIEAILSKRASTGPAPSSD